MVIQNNWCIHISIYYIDKQVYHIEYLRPYYLLILHYNGHQQKAWEYRADINVMASLILKLIYNYEFLHLDLLSWKVFCLTSIFNDSFCLNTQNFYFSYSLISYFISLFTPSLLLKACNFMFFSLSFSFFFNEVLNMFDLPTHKFSSFLLDFWWRSDRLSFLLSCSTGYIAHRYIVIAYPKAGQCWVRLEIWKTKWQELKIRMHHEKQSWW